MITDAPEEARPRQEKQARPRKLLYLQARPDPIIAEGTWIDVHRQRLDEIVDTPGLRWYGRAIARFGKSDRGLQCCLPA